MIDLTNNINDISYLQDADQDDEINGFVQFKSSEDILFSKRETTQYNFKECTLKANELDHMRGNTYVHSQKESQGM